MRNFGRSPYVYQHLRERGRRAVQAGEMKWPERKNGVGESHYRRQVGSFTMEDMANTIKCFQRFSAKD